jgi:hypothetical protein
MKRRAHIRLKTKLAAALCHMLRDDGTGNLVPIISYEDAKQMSEEQILSVFQFDHDPIAKHLDGPDEHWNLKPRPIIEHRQKTAQIDTPQAAKAVRLSAEHEDFRQRMLAKAGQGEAPSQRQGKGRPMPGSRRSGFRKKMDGTVERR